MSNYELVSPYSQYMATFIGYYYFINFYASIWLLLLVTIIL